MTYVVLATSASLALHAPLGMAIGFLTALIVALAQSHGTMPERIHQILAMGHPGIRCTIILALFTPRQPQQKSYNK